MIKRFLPTFLAFVFIFTSVPVMAQLEGHDSAPGDSCADLAAGATRVNASPDQDGTEILLICDGSVWQAANSGDDLGDHTATKDINLSGNNLVNGGSVQIANDSDSCTAAKDGAIRYVSGGDPPWEFCDGGATTWLPFKQPRCEDDDTGECYLDADRANDDPDFTAANIADGVNILGVTGTYMGGGAFLKFPDLTNRNAAAEIDSLILQTSLAGSSAISVSGDGAPEYRICADADCVTESHAWSSAAGSIDDGEYLQLRLTTECAFADTSTATVTVNAQDSDWRVTTTESGEGSFDTSFDPGTGASGSIFALALQPDGKILIGGNFTTYNGTALSRIARINANGSLDTSLNPGSGVVGGSVRVVALQPDGKILIGGGFTSYNGTARNGIVRINANGSLDTSFNPGSGANDQVWDMALQPDGKFLIGGNFTTYNGTALSRIARIDANGSLDTSFDPGSGASGSVRVVALRPDGKTVIGGLFTSYNGTARTRIARINADGSLDTSFNPGSGLNNVAHSLALQPDGKILIGGNFTTYNGTALSRVARINADGSVDTSFDPGTGANGHVTAIAILPDGKILIGGYFTSYDDTPWNRIARIKGTATLPCP